MIKKTQFLAEFFGTLWLVLGGCGVAIFASQNVGFFGVASGFGLSVLAMIYALGPYSGGHFNPAISFGVFLNGRMPGKTMLYYWIAQVLGGIAAAFFMWIVVKCTNMQIGDFAANGYGEFFAGAKDYLITNTLGAFLIEFFLTFILVLVVLGATDTKSNIKFAGIAIGLTVMLCNVIAIPLTNCSVNPARSIGPALFSANSLALVQLWLFIVAPLAGGALAAFCYKLFGPKKDEVINPDTAK